MASSKSAVELSITVRTHLLDLTRPFTASSSCTQTRSRVCRNSDTAAFLANGQTYLAESPESLAAADAIPIRGCRTLSSAAATLAGEHGLPSWGEGTAPQQRRKPPAATSNSEETAQAVGMLLLLCLLLLISHYWHRWIARARLPGSSWINHAAHGSCCARILCAIHDPDALSNAAQARGAPEHTVAAHRKRDEDGWPVPYRHIRAWLYLNPDRVSTCDALDFPPRLASVHNVSCMRTCRHYTN